MTTFIPPRASKRYNSPNRGDVLGNIVETHNMNFQNRGYASLSAKPIVLYSETDDADFEAPLAILMDDDAVFVVTSEHTWAIDPSTADVTVSNLHDDGGTPPSNSFHSDGVFFDGELHVSDTTGVHHYTAGAFAQSLTGLSSSYPHPLCVSEHQNYLAVGNGNSVIVYNTSYASQATMTIPADHVVTWIRWRANYLWCGTRNILGGEAKVFVWNGSGTAAQASYGVGGDWAFSGCNYPGTMVVVSSTGQILRFSGDGFVPFRDASGNEMAFPCYWANRPWGSSSSTSNLVGKISSRGMQAKGNLIYMMVYSEIATGQGGIANYLPNFPSGVWILDPEVGLYHRAGLDHLTHVTRTISDITSNLITIPATVFETGDPVRLDAPFTTGAADIVYYAIKVSSTTLYLARTPREAKEDVRVSLSGSITSATLFMNTYEGIGATKLARGGGLAVVQSLVMERFVGGEVIWGGEVNLPGGGIIGAVMSFGMGRNEGSYVTPKIQAENFTDAFKKLMAKFPTLNNDTWKIQLKYRVEDRWGLPGRQDFDNGSATWVNDTSFTINPTTYDVYALEEGDEVKFLEKGAAGYTRHVSSIVEDSATQWTITIDEAVPDVTASDTSDVLFNNWIKYKTISNTNDAKAAAKGLKEALVSQKAKWIQIKILIEGFVDMNEEPRVEEIMLLTGADQRYA